MEPAGTASRRFPSKFLLTIVPGLVASGVAASVLYAVHVSRAPSVSDYLSEPTPQSDGLSAEERRDLTRQMLKARRENAEQPAQVLPLPPLDAAAGPMDGDTAVAVDPKIPPADAKTVDAKVPDGRAPDIRPDLKTSDVNGPDAKSPDTRVSDPQVVDPRVTDLKASDSRLPDARLPDAKAPDSKAAGSVAKPAPDRPAAERAIATAPLPLPRPPVVARPHPDVPTAAASAQQPPAMASGPTPLGGQGGQGFPTQQGLGGQPGLPPVTPYGGTQASAAAPPPVTANAAPPQPDQEHHGFAAGVLSGLSSAAGSAANATGNTVNWVIDLPGKAINAGGKLIGINHADDQAGAPAPGSAPPPATAPPPAKNNNL
jgi:hypothetical protein